MSHALFLVLEYWDPARRLHDTEVVELTTETAFALGSGWQTATMHRSLKEAEAEAAQLRAEAQALGYCRGHNWPAQC